MTWVFNNLDLIWSLTISHLRQSAIPIVLGFILAIPVGWFAFRFTKLRGLTLTVVGLLYTIPSLGLFAVLTALFGIPMLSETNLVVALTIYAVAVMSRSVADGFVSIDKTTREAAVAVGFGGWRRFWSVDFPLAGPVLLAGIRVTATSTISLATVGALIGVQNLGYLFTNGFQRQLVGEVFAGVIMVVAVAIVIDVVLVTIGKLLMPWLPRRSERRTRVGKAALT